MTPLEAREIADEHIVWWQGGRYPLWSEVKAVEAWAMMFSARYPGGGWERVRAEMIRWLLDNAQPLAIAA